MLDKSSEQILNNNLTYIQKEFEQNIPSIVLCSESFHKIEFLNRLINSVKDPIIFIDMDLLYTGYVESGMIQKKNNVTIFHPNKTNWKEKLREIIIRISKEKSLVVIDSFNGVYNMFDDLEFTRFVNSCIMLLASIGKQTRCTVVVTTIARKKENDSWVLSPGGKQIIKSGKTGVYFLKKIENDLVINTIKKPDLNSKIFTITQESN
ncbi:MAG: ELP5 family protein [Nitrosopumilus sp.]|nr:ELP5 family protein [Nitrosopumilus sp.]